MSNTDGHIVDALWSKRRLMHLQLLFESVQKYPVIPGLQWKLILIILAFDDKSDMSCSPVGTLQLRQGTRQLKLARRQCSSWKMQYATNAA